MNDGSTASAGLPHQYPFRLVDRIVRAPSGDRFEGAVEARVSAGGRAVAAEAWGSPLLLAEAVAQSALLLQGGDPAVGRRGFLAGLDGFVIDRPPRAGDTLTIEVRLAARFGAIVRFEGRVTCGAEEIARGAVLVRQGGLVSPAPPEAG